ncbi:MAG: hypothetical protein IJS65_00800, partial [Clostridia bacterium]|nr:hypothetical protein [Clostridia bacterium]
GDRGTYFVFANPPAYMVGKIFGGKAFTKSDGEPERADAIFLDALVEGDVVIWSDNGTEFDFFICAGKNKIAHVDTGGVKKFYEGVSDVSQLLEKAMGQDIYMLLRFSQVM